MPSAPEVAPAYLGRSRGGAEGGKPPAPRPWPPRLFSSSLLHVVLLLLPTVWPGLPPSSPPPGVKAENPGAGPACVRAGRRRAASSLQSLSAARGSQLKCERSGGRGGRATERAPGSGQGASGSWQTPSEEGGDLRAQALTRGAGAARHSPAARPLPCPAPARGRLSSPGAGPAEAAGRGARGRGAGQPGLRGGRRVG